MCSCVLSITPPTCSLEVAMVLQSAIEVLSPHSFTNRKGCRSAYPGSSRWRRRASPEVRISTFAFLQRKGAQHCHTRADLSKPELAWKFFDLKIFRWFKPNPLPYPFFFFWVFDIPGSVGGIDVLRLNSAIEGAEKMGVHAELRVWDTSVGQPVFQGPPGMVKTP